MPTIIGISMQTAISSEAAVKALARNGAKSEYFTEGMAYINDGNVQDHEAEIKRLVTLYFQRYDGLILPGNDDHVDPLFFNPKTETQVDLRSASKRRNKLEIALVKEAIKRGIPVLGLCGGHQIINVALGGQLKNVEDIRKKDMPTNLKAGLKMPQRAGTTLVDYQPNTALHTIIQAKTPVKKRTKDHIVSDELAIHMQAVDPDKLNPVVVVSALEENGMIAGIEVNGHPWMIGTQFHPEFFAPEDIAYSPLAGEYNNALFNDFIAACSDVKEQKSHKVKVHEELTHIKFSDQAKFKLLEELFIVVNDKKWLGKAVTLYSFLIDEVPSGILALRACLKTLPTTANNPQALEDMFQKAYVILKTQPYTELIGNRVSEVGRTYLHYKQKFDEFVEPGRNVQSKLKSPQRQPRIPPSIKINKMSAGITTEVDAYIVEANKKFHAPSHSFRFYQQLNKDQFVWLRDAKGSLLGSMFYKLTDQQAEITFIGNLDFEHTKVDVALITYAFLQSMLNGKGGRVVISKSAALPESLQKMGFEFDDKNKKYYLPEAQIALLSREHQDILNPKAKFHP